jgi:Holliday junction resolvasome RuvABC endonuclease subunit
VSAAGVDPSIASTGIAVLYEGGYSFDRIRSKAGADSLFARVARMEGMVTSIRAALLPVPDLEVIVFEGAAFGSKNAMGHMLGGYWWMLAAGLIDLAPIAVAQPATVKKFATDDGRAGKPEMVVAAQRAFPDAGLLSKDHDIADAAALAGLGAMKLGIDWGGAFVPSGGMGSVRAVRWPTELMEGSDHALTA